MTEHDTRRLATAGRPFKQGPVRLAFLVLLLAAFPAAAQDPAATGQPLAAAVELPRQLEHKTFDLINQYREAEGLPRLVWNSAIANIARLHSRDMATGEVGFGHGGFRERMSELHDLFAGMRGGGENVFYTDAVPGVARAAVQAWLHSPPHLHNIRGDYQSSGLGLWRRSDGAYFFTQIFVKVAPPEPEVP
jgi:uncharacterized protein YkwD